MEHPVEINSIALSQIFKILKESRTGRIWESIPSDYPPTEGYGNVMNSGTHRDARSDNLLG